MQIVSKQFFLYGILTALCAVSVFVAACSEEVVSPEERLRTWLTQMETAVTEKKLDDIKSLISPDYQDAQGNNRSRIMLRLALWFKQYNNIALDNTINDISTTEHSARMELTTRFSQSAAFARFGLTDNEYTFVLLFEPDGEQWLLNNVTYHRITHH